MEKDFRFRSARGSIYSNDPNAFTQKITTSTARQLLNDLYEKLCEYDKEAAEAICKRRNA